MKIVHLSSSDSIGGAAKAATRIHLDLLERNVDSTLIVGEKKTSQPKIVGPLTPFGRLWRKIARKADQLPTRILQKKGPHSLALFGSPWALKTAKSLKPDLVQLYWICGGFLTPSQLTQFDCPIIWRQSDSWAISGTEHLLGDTTRYRESYQKDSSGFDLERWNWKRKERAWKNWKNLTLVCPSHWLAQRMKESPLFSKRRIEVIPTGQNTQIFFPREKHSCRTLLGLPPQKKLILFGCFNPIEDFNKGFDLLRKALFSLSTSLGSKKKEIQLVVLGAERPKSDLGLGFRTNYLGRISDESTLAQAYSAADLFVAPSREENLSNAVMESMACGTPVVAFRIGGMPELIEHQKTGYLAEPFSTDDLHLGIRQLLDDTFSRTAGIESRKQIESHFTLQKQTDRYLSLYEDLLKDSHRKPDSRTLGEKLENAQKLTSQIDSSHH